MEQILIIEDDTYTADIVCRFLQKCGYSCWQRNDGKEGKKFLVEHLSDLDLVILDISLPNINGLQICSFLRQRDAQIPILMLTSTGDTDSIVKALDLGADDYLSKPFSLAELRARISALLRRPTYLNSRQLVCGALRLDLDLREVWYGDKLLNLRRKEFDVLYFLAKNQGQTVSRDKILNNVWGLDADPFPNTIDVHIRQIRKKLAAATDVGVIITVHGCGYKLVSPE